LSFSDFNTAKYIVSQCKSNDMKLTIRSSIMLAIMIATRDHEAGYLEKLKNICPCTYAEYNLRLASRDGFIDDAEREDFPN